MSTHAELMAIVAERAKEWEDAAQKVDEAAEALNEAKNKASIARLFLSRAMIAADELLPKATVHTGRDGNYKVAIVKRTPSTVLTRAIGAEQEQAWRRSKYLPSTWNKYPKVKSYGWHRNPEYLTIDGEDDK